MNKLAIRLISVIFVVSVIIGCQKQDDPVDPVIPNPEITKKYLKKTSTSQPGQPYTFFNYNYNDDAFLSSSYTTNIDGDTLSKFIYLYDNNKLEYMLYSFHSNRLDTISYSYSADTVNEYWHTNGNLQLSLIFLRNDQGEDYYIELYDRFTGELTNKYIYVWENKNLVEAIVESMPTSIIDTYTYTYHQGIMNPMIDLQMNGYRDSQDQVSTVKKNGVIMTNESYILLDQVSYYPTRVKYGVIEYIYEYY